MSKLRFYQREQRLVAPLSWARLRLRPRYAARVPTRPATLSDVSTLVELMHEFYAEASMALDRPSAAAAFSQLLGYPQLGAAWLLLDGRAPVGHVVLTVRFAMEQGGLDAFVDDLFVRAAHRRKGLARDGLEVLFVECRRRRVRAINVEVAEDNEPARRLYASFGLRPRTDRRLLLTTPVEP